MQLRRPAWARLRREGDGRWRVTGTVLALVAVVVGLVAVLTHAVGTHWQPAIVLASGAHYPMWASAVALVLALIVRRWATAVLALALTAVVVAYQAPEWTSADVPQGGTPVVVMQANLRLGQADPAPIVARVRAEHVDVLTTEELTLPAESGLREAGLERELPYHYLAATAGAGNGIGIWSRYPVSRDTYYPDFQLKVISVRVALPGRAFTLVAVHLMPPYPYPSSRWVQEIARLRGVLRGQTASTPVIASGDFNATVDNQQFRALLGHGYADAADQAGAGYLRTYPTDHGPVPLIAIDHVLTRDAVAASLRTVALPNSDHRGLLGRVVLRPAG